MEQVSDELLKGADFPTAQVRNGADFRDGAKSLRARNHRRRELTKGARREIPESANGNPRRLAVAVRDFAPWRRL